MNVVHEPGVGRSGPSKLSLQPDHGVGVLFVGEHGDALAQSSRGIDWAELVTEDLMASRARAFRPAIPRAVERLAGDLPVTLHGVELSIGGVDPLDTRYLAALKELIRIFDPILVSDHFCFTSAMGRCFHELAPLPCTESMAAYLVDRIRYVQDFLGVRVAFENPPSYVTYAVSTTPEAQFFAHVAEEADCLLLLDVSNVGVSSANNGFDADGFIRALPRSRVAQLHVAGHHREQGRRFLLDTHASKVRDATWRLYERALSWLGPVSTNIEWDVHVPSFEHLRREAVRAREIRDAVFARQPAMSAARRAPNPVRDRSGDPARVERHEGRRGPVRAGAPRRRS